MSEGDGAREVIDEIRRVTREVESEALEEALRDLERIDEILQVTDAPPHSKLDSIRQVVYQGALASQAPAQEKKHTTLTGRLHK